jgi:predicted Fe-S protein YdhL (DUF1289 family)
MTSGPPSPCINVCVLDEADVCRGCYRSRAEIAAWTSMSAAEQWRVLEVVARRREQSQRLPRPDGEPAC